MSVQTAVEIEVNTSFLMVIIKDKSKMLKMEFVVIIGETAVREVINTLQSSQFTWMMQVQSRFAIY